jgi:hypothetical protein
MNRNPDPKPGRWMLPVAVGGMVLFAWLFVTNLDVASDPAPTTSTTTDVDGNGTNGTTTTTSSTTTTTTLPPAMAQYQADVTEAQSQVASFLERANKINSDWDNRTTTGVEFGATRTALQELQGDVQAFRAQFSAVAAPTDLIPGLADPQERMSARADNLEAQAAAMIVGLEAPDTGEARRLALQRFQESAGAFDAQSTIALELISGS